MFHNRTILFIGVVWPEPNSSAAGSRMMQLLHIFQQQEWKITFASTASDSDYMSDLEAIGIDRKSIDVNSPDFDSFVTLLRPSIVIFDRFISEEQFGWRVAKFCPDALRILDTEDLHCLRKERQIALKQQKEFKIVSLLDSELAKREIASIYRCDLSLFVSEVEIQVVSEIFKIDNALTYYLPLLYDEMSITTLDDFPKFDDRSDFIFIGNFHHEPNRDAVIYLKEVLWPLIHQQLPTAFLRIYGAYMTSQILQMDDAKSNFMVVGRAGDAQQVISDSRVMLAPLRFGAGIKGKLLEAMACGTPSVTTNIGTEAMPGKLPWNGLISDDPNEFANAAVQLYIDSKAWQQSQRNGIAIINQRFLMSNFAPIFYDKILELQLSLKEHRTKNFIGVMLMHHSMSSTKYLSRWIELKNKP